MLFSAGFSTQIPSPSDSFDAFHGVRVSVKREDDLLYLYSFNVVILSSLFYSATIEKNNTTVNNFKFLPVSY